MNGSRREVLTAGAALALAGLAVFNVVGDAAGVGSMGSAIPWGARRLYLHSGEPEAAAFTETLGPGPWVARRFRPIGPGGFGEATTLLDNARGLGLSALLAPAEAVILGAMLHARGLGWRETTWAPARGLILINAQL